MSHGHKRKKYKEYAKNAYTYYRKNGITGGVRDGWIWLLDKPERLTAISTFFIFLATAVIVGVSLAQWRALKNQLTELHEQTVTTRAQVRANIGPEGLVARPIIGNGTVTGWDVNPGWKNVGATDAKEYRNWFQIPFIEGLNKKWGPVDCPKIPDTPSGIEPNIIQAGHGISELAQRMSMIDVLKEINHQGALYAVGHLEYRDIFPDDPIHFFDWCVLISPNDAQATGFSFINMRQKSD